MNEINKLIKDKTKLSDRVSAGLERALKLQKQNGKKFISDEEIDKLIDDVINEELGGLLKPKEELTQENCPHPSHRVRENISGGRFDECLDCGKRWG